MSETDSDSGRWTLAVGRWTLDLDLGLNELSALASAAVESARKMPDAKAKVGSEVHERLCRARAFINERYHEPIDLDEISREACLSRYHFLRLFREEFATTPHQYLIDRRIFGRAGHCEVRARTTNCRRIEQVRTPLACCFLLQEHARGMRTEGMTNA